MAVGCSGGDGADPEGPVPDLEGVRLERMFATTMPNGRTRFGGFDGALEATIEVQGKAIVGDDDGRFEIDLDPAEALTVVVADRTLTFRVREPGAARAAAVGEPIGGTGDIPNDLVVDDGPRGARGILVRSGDNAVSEFDLEEGLIDGRPAIRLPRTGDQVAAPWFVTPFDDSGVRYVVSAQKQHRLYVLDLEAGSILHTLLPPTVQLDAPFTLSRPFDLDGDGTEESTIERVQPLAPQPVVVHDGRLYAAFAGVVRASNGALAPIYVPAVLAVWRVDALAEAPDTYVLPTLNPQELRIRSDGRVAVVSSGMIQLGDGTVTTLSEGAVDVFDPTSKTFVERYPLGFFGPTTALFIEDHLWVGSLSTASVRSIALNDPQDIEDFDLTGVDEVNSVFRLVDLGGGLIAAPTFNRDDLYILDTRARVVSPPPFFAPLRVGAGPPVVDGLQIVAPREGRRGVDFVGPDLFAMSGLAARITPVELRKLLGP